MTLLNKLGWLWVGFSTASIIVLMIFIIGGVWAGVCIACLLTLFIYILGGI